MHTFQASVVAFDAAKWSCTVQRVTGYDTLAGFLTDGIDLEARNLNSVPGAHAPAGVGAVVDVSVYHDSDGKPVYVFSMGSQPAPV